MVLSQSGPPCPACSGALHSAPKAGKTHFLIPFWIQTSPPLSRWTQPAPFIRPNLFPYSPVSKPWNLIVDRGHDQVSGICLEQKTLPVWLYQESTRVLPSFRNPSPKMEGRLKVPYRLQRDKDSCLQGVSQLPAALISRVQSPAWEPSPFSRPPSPASSPDGSFCPAPRNS